MTYRFQLNLYVGFDKMLTVPSPRVLRGRDCGRQRVWNSSLKLVFVTFWLCALWYPPKPITTKTCWCEGWTGLLSAHNSQSDSHLLKLLETYTSSEPVGTQWPLQGRRRIFFSWFGMGTHRFLDGSHNSHRDTFQGQGVLDARALPSYKASQAVFLISSHSRSVWWRTLLVQ